MKKKISVTIQEKIMAIQQVEDHVPGAIIIHDIRDFSVVHMSKWGQSYLNVDMTALREMGKEYHDRFFNPDDVKDYAPRIFGLLERNNNDEFISFFQQVRQSPQHEWAWFSSATRIILWDEQNKPLLILTTATPIDIQHRITAKGSRLLDEIKFLRKNYQVFDSLTKREKEILKMMALGDTSAKMAKQIYISEKTAATHRKNIKRKLNIESNYDVTRFAQAFDLV
jgi:DNA-binding CsgD family transcriptional regulator